MNAKRANSRPVDEEELEQALLNVQRERVALTEAFMRLNVECSSSGIEMLVVRLLRLQRETGAAQKLAATARHNGFERRELRSKGGL